MQFAMTHRRQTIGQQIEVTVTGAGGQTIAQVTTQFDGFTIGDDALAPGSTQYDRTFDGQSAAMGASHTLVVTALDESGKTESATKIWTDPS